MSTPKKVTISSKTPSSRGFNEGSRIEGNFKNKAVWYPGKITAVRFIPNEFNKISKLYDIKYDDGDKEKYVDANRIRSISISNLRYSRGDEEEDVDANRIRSRSILRSISRSRSRTRSRDSYGEDPDRGGAMTKKRKYKNRNTKRNRKK
jgi:hypothetical protein